MRRYSSASASAALAIGALVTANLALAKDPKGPPGQEPQQQGPTEEKKAGDKGKGAAGQGEKKAKHKHVNKGGKALLGEKIKKDGKHNLGKAGKHDVIAEVKGGKVKNMTAGDLPVKHVKSKDKMASVDRLIRLAAVGPIQLAQYDDWYYGFCFDDGYDYYCYWYEADDVYYEDYTWEEYDPYW